MDELNPKCVLKDWVGADLATTALPASDIG